MVRGGNASLRCASVSNRVERIEKTIALGIHSHALTSTKASSILAIAIPRVSPPGPYGPVMIPGLFVSDEACMVAQFVAALERPISRVRLENYRNGSSDLDMVVNYFFNLELSEALYPTLQAFEVALRNSVHLTLQQHFGTPYWFDTQGLYPPPPPPETIPWQEKAIQAARDNLSDHNKPHDADRIVAELHLGFWNSLFNRPFAQPLWLPNQGALLTQVFAHATRSQQVSRHIEKRITRIRLLRNRVMHFEPIWSRRHLQQSHAQILEMLLWISPAMHETIAMCDRFAAVYGGGRADMEKRIQTEIQKRYP